jgi:hypothetical protein
LEDKKLDEKKTTEKSTAANTTVTQGSELKENIILPISWSVLKVRTMEKNCQSKKSYKFESLRYDCSDER